jgi:hypothetical protein
MQARGNAHPLERLLLDKSLANQLENGHLLVGPFNFSLALLGKRHVLDITGYGLR